MICKTRVRQCLHVRLERRVDSCDAWLHIRGADGISRNIDPIEASQHNFGHLVEDSVTMPRELTLLELCKFVLPMTKRRAQDGCFICGSVAM